MNSESNVPRILIVSRWEEVIAIARLPRALKRAGFEVAALCTKESFLSQTKYLDERFLCPRRHHRLLDAFLSAVIAWKPDLLLPGNDWDRAFLQRIATAPLFRMAESFVPGLANLLERSLGNPAMFDIVGSKAAQQDLAARLGISTPGDQVISRTEVAFDYADRWGYPVVLKRDLESGGNGVWICSDERELASALEHAQMRPEQSAGWNARGALKNMIHGALLVPRQIVQPKLTIQRFVAGRGVVHSLTAMKGEVVGAVTVEIVRNHPIPTGPCSVVRPMRARPIERAAKALVAAMQHSGFGCFDFIVDEKTQEPVFIEFNAIPTNVAHLGDRLGNDLCLSVYDWITGARSNGRARRADAEREVALFPQELRRDPKSSYVSHSFHDVPADDPALLNAFVRHFGVGMAPARGQRRTAD